MNGSTDISSLSEVPSTFTRALHLISANNRLYVLRKLDCYNAGSKEFIVRIDYYDHYSKCWKMMPLARFLRPPRICLMMVFKHPLSSLSSSWEWTVKPDECNNLTEQFSPSGSEGCNLLELDSSPDSNKPKISWRFICSIV